MTVHFIGAGPGDPELITVKGRRLISECRVCLYAGSLVPEAVVAAAPEGARVLDTAPMTLDEIVAEMAAAHAAGLDVARVHSGDPSLYGAIAEQIRRLRALDIPYEITPGVPAYAAFAVRWLHVITAIAWIGSSFYFIALDLGLNRNMPGPRTARNGRSMAAASTTSRNTWSRPRRCPSI
jgi:precorrin-4 methylase